MASTTTSVQAFDALGGRQAFKVEQDTTSGALTPHHAIEADGLPVGAAHPMPVAGVAVAPVASATIEAAHVLKSSAGTIYALQANATQSGYVMLFDSSTVPADGAVTPIKAWFFSSAAQATIDKSFNPPLAMHNGIIVVFSTTGPFVKTAAASAQFSAEVA
jgi:hypothetical protein